MTSDDFMRDPTLEEYVGGASVSFGLVTLVLQILGGIISYKGLEEKLYLYDPLIALILYLALHIVSGWLGAYLVTRRIQNTRIRLVRAGLLTGLGAYIIEAIVTLIFVRSFPQSAWALIGFVFGGSLGGMTSSIFPSKARL